MDNFRFQCLLGSDFMTKHGLRIQYGMKTVVVRDGKGIPFFQLDDKRPALLCTDVLVSTERAMLISKWRRRSIIYGCRKSNRSISNQEHQLCYLIYS